MIQANRYPGNSGHWQYRWLVAESAKDIYQTIS